jgi:hypothetical protein
VSWLSLGRLKAEEKRLLPQILVANSYQVTNNRCLPDAGTFHGTYLYLVSAAIPSFRIEIGRGRGRALQPNCCSQPANGGDMAALRVGIFRRAFMFPFPEFRRAAADRAAPGADRMAAIYGFFSKLPSCLIGMEACATAHLDRCGLSRWRLRKR